MWEEQRTYSNSQQQRWKDMDRQMNEQMRKSEEHDALMRKLAPYFNAGLVLSLIALGVTSFYIQISSRNGPHGPYRAFLPDEDPGVTHDTRHRGMKSSFVSLDASDYQSIDPHRKYNTRWDDITASIKKRDDFYKALLRFEDQKDVQNPQQSKTTI
jgi:hypothetical protein